MLFFAQQEISLRKQKPTNLRSKLSKKKQHLNIKCTATQFNVFKSLKKKRTFFFVCFGCCTAILKKSTILSNSYLKKDNNNFEPNQVFSLSLFKKKQFLYVAKSHPEIWQISGRRDLLQKNYLNTVQLQNLKTINFCLNKITVQFPLVVTRLLGQQRDLKFKGIFTNFYTNNYTALQNYKINRCWNNFHSLAKYNFNFYRSNTPKLHIKLFNQDLLYFQKKNFWYTFSIPYLCQISSSPDLWMSRDLPGQRFFNNKKNLTLIFYFNNLTKKEQYFFLYRKYFFPPICCHRLNCFISANTRSKKKAQLYLKTLTNLKKIKDFFFKYLLIRIKYLLIKNKFIFFKNYFFLREKRLGSLRSSIPFINRQISRFIYFLNFLQTFHEIQIILFSSQIISAGSRSLLWQREDLPETEMAQKKQNILIHKSQGILKIDSSFFVCYFIIKPSSFLLKTKFLIQSNKSKIAQYANNFKYFLNKYLAKSPKIYKNKDLQNLNFYLIIASLHYKNKKIRKNFYSLIKNVFLERNNGLLHVSEQKKFIFSFKFLDNLLFAFLFNWAKNQHKNNKSSWIFTNYWLFIQPFPYFFSNQAYFNVYPLVLQDKTKACGHSPKIEKQKNQDICLIDKQILLNYLLKKLGDASLCRRLPINLLNKYTKNTQIQHQIFLSLLHKIKKRISNKISQCPKIIDEIEIVNIQFKKVFSFLLPVFPVHKKNKLQLLVATSSSLLADKQIKKKTAYFLYACSLVNKKQQQQIKIKNQILKKNLKTYYLDKYKIFFFPVKKNLRKEKTLYGTKKKKLKEFTFGTKLIIFKKILLDNFKSINLGLYLKNEEFSF
jgi:hypothetical protein